MCVPQCSLGQGWDSQDPQICVCITSQFCYDLMALEWDLRRASYRIGSRGTTRGVLLRPEGVHRCVRGIAVYSSGTIWYGCHHHGRGRGWLKS